MKLIKIKKNHYVSIDNSKIKEGDLVLSKLNEIVVFEKTYNKKLYKKITHSTKPIEFEFEFKGGGVHLVEVYRSVKKLSLKKKIINS